MEEALSTKALRHDSHPSSHYVYDIPHWIQEGIEEERGLALTMIPAPTGSVIVDTIPRFPSIPNPPEPGVGCHTYSGMGDGNRVASLWVTALFPSSMITRI